MTGEAQLPIPPLEIPAPDTAADVLLRYHPVELFVDQGRAARPDFVLDAATASKPAVITPTPGGDPTKDRYVHEGPAVRMTIVSVTGLEMVPATAVALVDDGVERIDICGGLGRFLRPPRSRRSGSAREWLRCPVRAGI